MTFNKMFHEESFIENMKNNYKNGIECETGAARLICTPFKVLKLTPLLESSKYINRLRDDITKLPFNRKNNDLYSLWQSDDLHFFGHITSIKKFIEILRYKVGPMLSRLFDVELNEKLSITASMFKNNDMLLCHDDKCEDRCIAFVFYLTGAGKDTQGPFQMFDHDGNGQPTAVVESIPPVVNSFVCFEVGNWTYHEVGEVRDKDFQRLSINGWFHSKRKIPLLKYVDPFPKLYSQINNQAFMFMDEYITISYCTTSVQLQIQKQFEINSYVLLPNFFLESFYDACAEGLKDARLVWNRTGPPNRRKYDSVDINSLSGSIGKLTKLVRSPVFINNLRNMTNIALAPLSAESEESPSKLILEVQKWNPGYYTMATDNDAFFDKSGLDLYIFFNTKNTVKDLDKNGGCTTYLAIDEDEEDEDHELLNITPLDNALIIVYRTTDTIRFTKYINSNIAGNFFCLTATYFEPNEV